MPPARQTRVRDRGHLGRGSLLSLLLHAQLLVPLAIAAFIYGGREEAQRAEEVDVGFESVADDELPKDLPAIEPTTDDLQPLPPEAKKDKKPPKEKEKPKPKDKLAEKQPDKADKKKPEPEIVVPPLPPMPPPEPPKPPEPRSHEKMVDLDNEKDVPPPPDAKFLAQKNNRAEVETRATETNLQKAQKGEDTPASAPSDRQDEQIGADKEKIAQLADQKSKAGREAPEVTPHENPELASEDQHRERSLLALRDPAPRTHEITPETADPSLPKAADGELRDPHPTTRGDQSRVDRARASHVKLAITGHDYEYLFGADAEADRKLASTLKSMHRGKFQERQARVRSSLENFIPEVKPGNQTALNTRAAPFAAFVARMHRSIHALWGFGALEDWDELGSSSPLNNPNLLTTLEMVLNADGTVDKVTVVKASGYTPYDAAAIDTAFSAGPYPDPPREIRSKNGKIYVHWRFYRDARQCATSGVDTFILDNPPADGDSEAMAHTEAPVAPGREGPRRLRRDLDDAHRAKLRALDDEVARAEGQEESGGESPSEAPRAPKPAEGTVAEARDEGARALANRWFSALFSGDAGALAGIAETPFRATGGTTVKSPSELRTMLKDLANEAGRPTSGVRVFTSAGLRAVLGKLPPGLDDGSGLLFATVPLQDGDTLIAAIAKRSVGYRVVALVRR
ncbi:MAG TPA: TonB family protein [Polyangia bacterium]|nr:TonB family protein [Polyangia bacterium]